MHGKNRASRVANAGLVRYVRIEPVGRPHTDFPRETLTEERLQDRRFIIEVNEVCKEAESKASAESPAWTRNLPWWVSGVFAVAGFSMAAVGTGLSIPGLVPLSVVPGAIGITYFILTREKSTSAQHVHHDKCRSAEEVHNSEEIKSDDDQLSLSLR